MARMQVLAEMIKQDDNNIDWESMGMPRPKTGTKKVWIRRGIESENVEYYDEINEDQTLLKMYNEDRILIDETFDSFNNRLFILENMVTFEPEEDEEEVQAPQPKVEEKK